MRRRSLATVAGFLFVVPSLASADPEPAAVENPYRGPDTGVNVVDLRPSAPTDRPVIDPPYAPVISLAELNDHIGEPPAIERPAHEAKLPASWGQLGDMIVPAPMVEGAQMVGSIPALSAAGPPRLDCAFPDAVSPGVYEGDDKPGGETPRRHTIFLNFMGGVLTAGGENSAENISNIARSGHMFPVYGGGESRAAAAAQAVAIDFGFVQTRVVYEERPRKLLPYTMVMVGGSYRDTTAGNSGGVAPLDCEDFGQRNVCYAFQNTSPAVSQANVISQEIGHTMGLGHTQGSDRIMGAGYSGASGDLIFGNDCTDVINVSGQAGGCPGLNKCHCGNGDQQHDRNTLLFTYAAPGIDEVPPNIEITAPEDEAEYPVGEAIYVDVEVGDNYGGYGWKLVVKDAETGDVMVDLADYNRLLQWKLVGVPAGRYEVIGEIEDQADNVTTDTIFINVGSGSGSSGGTAGTDSGGSSGTDSGGSSGTGSGGASGSGPSSGSGPNPDPDSDTGSGSGTDPDTDSGGMSHDDGSCTCATGAGSGCGWGGMAGWAAVGRRRRSG